MTTTPLPDTETRGLLSMLPAAARPYALLARFDRPIGWWLLYWPCAYALAWRAVFARTGRFFCGC
jgi:4-hydroxybenzoate polyprenyltransferase